MTTHRFACLAASLALGATLIGGCVVAPIAGPVPPPPGVAVIGPSYPMPAPGYVWLYHPRYGYGWHHPTHGWHRGWR